MRSFLHPVLFLLFCGGMPLSAQDGPVGWASLNGGTTGGEGGETVTVSTRGELLLGLQGNDARIILVNDTIDLALYERVKVFGNKTVRGASPDAMIRYGGLEIVGNNVIIQNLSIGDSYDGDFDGKTHSTDAITVYGQNVWIDHCWFYSAADGLVDIRSGNGLDADYITISNCRFSDHNKVSLIGSSNDQTESRGHLKTTYYNCWFDGTYGKRLHQRLPRVRFGDVHILNSYYEEIQSYCVAARFESNVVVENTFFRNSKNPHAIEDEGMGEREPELVATGNIYESSTGSRETGGDAFVPGDFYDYTALPTEEVPARAMNEAGPFNREENASPVAINDTVIRIGLSGPVEIDATANDSDSDGGELRIARVLTEAAGLLVLRENKITYVPSSSASGTEEIDYELVDTQGGVTTGKIFVVHDSTTTATREIVPAAAVRVYPNPATARVQVDVAATLAPAATLQILDAYGRQLPQTLIAERPSAGFTVDVHSLPRGLYLLVIRSENATRTERLTVSR